MQRHRPSVRVADKEVISARGGGSRKCEHPECSEKTREGKHYCPEHVEHLPYVVGVLAELEAREAELAAVKKKGWRAVNLTGGNCEELLLYLQLNGERTLPRIKRDVFPQVEDEEVVRAYVDALHRAKRVRIGSTRRGSVVVTLTPSAA